MTPCQALNSLEKRIKQVGIKEPFAIAWAKITSSCRSRSDWVDEQFLAGSLTIDAWYLEHMKIIEEYSRRDRGSPWD